MRRSSSFVNLPALFPVPEFEFVGAVVVMRGVCPLEELLFVSFLFLFFFSPDFGGGDSESESLLDKMNEFQGSFKREGEEKGRRGYLKSSPSIPDIRK